MYEVNSKKRIMYIASEDFYYYTYNIFIILNCLNCTNGKSFKDYRKLPFLVNVISDSHLIDILHRNDFQPVKNAIDRSYVLGKFMTSNIQSSEYLKLLFSLEKRGLITLSFTKKESVIDVSLNKSALDEFKLDKELFSKEINNMNTLKSNVQRLSILSLDNMFNKIYHSSERMLWAV